MLAPLVVPFVIAHVMLVAASFFMTVKVVVSASIVPTALVVSAFTVRLLTVHAVGATRKAS
jgi:hypothetical protein